jgi:hypothetical protein
MRREEQAMTEMVGQAGAAHPDVLEVIQQPGPPAVEALPARPEGRDDGVGPDSVCAVALGWATTTLYRVCSRPPGSAGEPAYLPTESELTPAEAARRYLERVEVGVARMRARLGDALDERLAALRAELAQDDRAQPLSAVRPTLREFHVRLLTVLAASDSRVGKSYALGAALARVADQLGEVIPPPADGRGGRTSRLTKATAQRQCATVDGQREELLRIHDQVRDLGSVLPEHVGQSVRESMAQWINYLDGRRRIRFTLAEREEALLLQRQIFLWKAVLVQEKSAIDSLSAADVLRVSVDAVRGLVKQALLTLRAMGGVVLLVILVGGGAVTAYAIAKSQTGTASTAIVSTVGGLAATTWRAGRTRGAPYLNELRARVQGSAEDAAIALAITVLPKDAVRRQVKRDARKRALVPHTSGSVASKQN